jgi:hypothetical protein
MPVPTEEGEESASPTVPAAPTQKKGPKTAVKKTDVEEHRKLTANPSDTAPRTDARP